MTERQRFQKSYRHQFAERLWERFTGWGQRRWKSLPKAKMLAMQTNEMRGDGNLQRMNVAIPLEAFFMGFPFLLAGYFTPGSLERKAPFKRPLSAPRTALLAFGLIFGPFTLPMVTVHVCLAGADPILFATS